MKLLKNDNYRYGVFKTENAYGFSVSSDADRIKILLFADVEAEPEYVVELDESFKEGSVFSVLIKDIKLDDFWYIYEINGMYYSDIYAKRVRKVMINAIPYYFSRVGSAKFNWKNDQKPNIQQSDMIIYKIHPSGFTKAQGSGVRNKGTFKGIKEKIPYFLELGINTLEFMPVYAHEREDGQNNFWGYGRGYYFSPNPEYCVDSDSDYTVELKTLVRELHAVGIEVILEMNFHESTPAIIADECIRYWKKEYHIDGIHILAREQLSEYIAEDDYLRDTKLFYTSWKNNKDNLYDYNDEFLYVSRQLLKGDENILQDYLKTLKNNNYKVNYIANNNGFTIKDLVSYDRKHNEANGEGNRDGADYNLSWNCGVEGDTKKRSINALRSRQMKNAACMLLTAQGIPLIYAGDEFGNSQQGNNNPYNQDNPTGWTDWTAKSRNKKYFEFVKMLIRFRKEHKILHMDKEVYLMDYRYLGAPDMSYHGMYPWYPELEHYNRHVGVMLFGGYAGEEEDIYIAFNLHWEKHRLAVPLIKNKRWKQKFSTASIDNKDSFFEEKGKVSLDVPPRSIIVLVSE